MRDHVSMPSLCLRTALVAIASVAAVGLCTTTAQAQSLDAVYYDGGKARVNRSASLRGLSEAVASASCRLNAGYDVETATAELASIHESFGTILNGLTNGDRTLGMPGAEQSQRIINALNTTSDLWSPMDAAAIRMLDGAGSDADAQLIQQGYAPLFDQTVILAAEVSGAYSNPLELLQSDATVLNFASRQRALAQRMTRAVCELASGTGTDETLGELVTTVDMFELSMTALLEGYPAAGVNPPPNDVVKGSLQKAYTIWQSTRGIFDDIKSGRAATVDDVLASNALTQQITTGMNNAITLYLIAAPGKDGIYRVPLEAYAEDVLSTWVNDPHVIEAVKAQNVVNAGLNEDDILALDQQWRTEAGSGGGPMIAAALDNDVSQWLRDNQAATAGFVTEVFVMDDKGLNVAQSVETSDYWQGDEAKYQQTYLIGPDALHISEIEYDDSTGFYQSQASVSVVDPDTGHVIGAMTFGINVQSLM